ncbi:MAG: RNA polymerase sigma factor [Rhizobacter sp.]|nr:RNA polymerase sigma factor [Chlorobiales bacterium]
MFRRQSPADASAEPISDEVLIAQSVEGNKQSLETLIKRHQDYIYNVALKLFLHPDDALDATQEVLIKVITGLKTFTGNCSFRTWLYRIVFNHFLNSPVRKTEALFDRNPLTLAAVAAEEDEQWVSEAQVQEARILCSTAMLMCLSREQRLIYIVGEIFGADHNLGAELFAVSPANFRVKLHRAKSDLLSYISGKCGLIDPANRCRCHLKAKVMIEQGIVDKDKMLFNTSYRQKISEMLAVKKDETCDDVQFRMRDLFQDNPFQIRNELDRMFAEIIR